MFYFYILECKDSTLYCGSTKDLSAREQKHNLGTGSKYVKAHGGGKIVYSENFKKWGKALSREAEVKKWTRIKKVELINQANKNETKLRRNKKNKISSKGKLENF